MTKRHWTLIVTALALLMALFAVIGARAQPATSDHIQLYVNGELVYDSGAPEPTTTPAPTATATPEPVGNGQPDPDDPPCPTHDPAEFHTIHDAERDCHYDHPHGTVDPRTLDGVLPPLVWDWFDDGPMAFAWATSDHESHNDYVWLVGTSDGRCLSRFGDGCFTHWRALVHNDFYNAGTRYHSKFFQARVCDESNPDECGTFAVAGWHDTGDLILDGEVVVGVDQSANRAPRAVKLHYNETGNDLFATWYPSSPAGWARVATQVGDMWGVYSYSESDGLTFDFACDTAAGCDRNGSRVQAHVLGFHITPYLQRTFGLAPEDGAYSFTALVDRYGFPAAEGCEPVSLDCLPMYVDGVPAAVEQFQHRDGRYMEMDVYFGDEPSGWIALPAVDEE